jgi:hypothetical protein
MSITLRDTNPEDEALLFKLYASSRTEEMALVPWTDEQREAFLRMQFTAQDSYYREKFPDADYKVILMKETPVGRLYIPGPFLCLLLRRKFIYPINCRSLARHR